MIRNVNMRIDEMERSIVDTLELQTAQLSGYIAQGTKATVGALDAQTKLLAQLVREEAETQSKLAHRPTGSGCRVITGMTGLEEGRAVAARAAGAAGVEETGRIGGDSGVVGEAGTEADTERRFEVWTQAHCSAGRLDAGAEVCGGQEGTHDADVKPGSLFDVETFGSDEQRLAARELGRNVAAPLVWDRFPLRAVDTPQDRELAMLARAADARSALAADWFVRSRAAREPATDLAHWAAALGGSEAGAAGELSRHELFAVLASRRFENPAWAVGLQEMGTDGLLREIALLLATSLMLDWERYGMEERRGAMEAARLALAAEEMRRLPGLEDWLDVRR
ncbi:MAG: hypothetical protein OXH50_05695 [Gemmatimonadetes bacterium]|nr:hypothetical protein [Gemmatimonadota bacterium]